MNVGKLEARMLCRLLERYKVVKVRLKENNSDTYWNWRYNFGNSENNIVNFKQQRFENSERVLVRLKRELIQLSVKCVRQGFNIRIATCSNQSTEGSSQRPSVHVKSLMYLPFKNTRKFRSKTVTSLGVMMIELLISRYFNVFFISTDKCSWHVLCAPRSSFPQRQDNCHLPSIGNLLRKILSFSKKFCSIKNKLYKPMEYLCIFFPGQLWKWNLPLLIGEFVDPWKLLLEQTGQQHFHWSLTHLESCNVLISQTFLFWKKLIFTLNYTLFVLPQTFLHPTYRRSFILIHW